MTINLIYQKGGMSICILILIKESMCNSQLNWPISTAPRGALHDDVNIRMLGRLYCPPPPLGVTCDHLSVCRQGPFLNFLCN